MMFELGLVCPEANVQDISEALEALDALSVSVEDADAMSEAEKALFGEPGMPPPKEGWKRSRIVALFAEQATAQDASRLLALQDFFSDSHVLGIQAVADQALATATRFMKESGVHAVKLEGGVRVADHIARISGAGIPVMGHIGFTPQSEHGLGGHVVQGRGEDAAKLIADGKAVEAAGAFAVVVEMVPKTVATQLASELTIPVIGIGAGNGVDGQILVWTDLAGMSTGRIPSFVKQYASLHETLRTAVTNWQNDVRSRAFPDDAHSFVD